MTMVSIKYARFDEEEAEVVIGSHDGALFAYERGEGMAFGKRLTDLGAGIIVICNPSKVRIDLFQGLSKSHFTITP
jgi:predicted transcriptional regulator